MSAQATTRTRRTFLAAAAGASVATLAVALDRPASVRAGSDGDVVLGAGNSTSSTTAITNTSEPSNDEEGYGLHASGKATGVVGSGPTGVRGEGTDFGVQGSGDVGIGGFSFTGRGVSGSTDSGAGVEAYAPLNFHTGRALDVHGRARFDRSGRVTLAAGRTYADVDLRPAEIPGTGLEGRPLCFAQLMSYRPGVFVTTMRPNYPIPGKARIYVNKAPTSDAYIAWFILD